METYGNVMIFSSSRHREDLQDTWLHQESLEPRKRFRACNGLRI